MKSNQSKSGQGVSASATSNTKLTVSQYSNYMATLE